MPAGYAFAVLPLISPMTRSSAFMNVAADTEMNSGLCTAAYGRFCGLGSCANAIADPNSVSAARVALIVSDDSSRSRRLPQPRHDGLVPRFVRRALDDHISQVHAKVKRFHPVADTDVDPAKMSRHRPPRQRQRGDDPVMRIRLKRVWQRNRCQPAVVNAHMHLDRIGRKRLVRPELQSDCGGIARYEKTAAAPRPAKALAVWVLVPRTKAVGEIANPGRVVQVDGSRRDQDDDERKGDGPRHRRRRNEARYCAHFIFSLGMIPFQYCHVWTSDSATNATATAPTRVARRGRLAVHA